MPLIVNVICARKLPGEWLETTDPYVKLRYGNQQHSTKSDKEGGCNPNFNQCFTFRIQDPPGLLEIAVFDQDLGFDDFLAKGVVDISEVLDVLPGLRPQPLRKFYSLHTKNGHPHGEVELEFIEGDA